MSSWRGSTPISNMSGGSGGGFNNNNNHLSSYPSSSSQQQQQQYSNYNNNNLTAATATTSSIETNGPRAKCDQVVFEAIAKAAEIVVGSRCYIDPSTVTVNQLNNNNNNNNNSSTSRFNLLVPEVQGVR